MSYQRIYAQQHHVSCPLDCGVVFRQFNFHPTRPYLTRKHFRQSFFSLCIAQGDSRSDGFYSLEPYDMFPSNEAERER